MLLAYNKGRREHEKEKNRGEIVCISAVGYAVAAQAAKWRGSLMDSRLQRVAARLPNLTLCHTNFTIANEQRQYRPNKLNCGNKSTL